MQYEIKLNEQEQSDIKINKVSLSDDSLSINVDVTIIYGIVGDSIVKSSIGTTINLLLDNSVRSSLVSELNEKIVAWFNNNYNPNTP